MSVLAPQPDQLSNEPVTLTKPHSSRPSKSNVTVYSGSKDPDSFDEAGVDNLNESPYLGLNSETEEESWAGLPSWFVLNFGTQYDISENIQLNFGVDNILNAHYKTFSSGISAPGRNFVFSAKYTF